METYCRAGDALSAALETAVASGLAPLIQRGEEILDVRSGHETDVIRQLESDRPVTVGSPGAVPLPAGRRGPHKYQIGRTSPGSVPLHSVPAPP